jgi:Protein of Unknown function (DUF2784)
MSYQIVASGLVLLHLGFVGFVVAGGLVCLKWHRVIWIHIPAVIWGIAIELTGWICPLTPLENYLRQKAGEQAYTNDFVFHYLMPILYPETLTRKIQLLMGLVVALINIAVYAYIIRSHKRRHQ